MELTEFSKHYERMCQYYNKNCSLCPLGAKFSSFDFGCYEFIMKFPTEAEPVVEYWNKAHPLRTRAAKFFKEVPDCPRSDDGYPRIAPCLLDRALGEKCSYSFGLETHVCPNESCNVCRQKYWEEVSDY